MAHLSEYIAGELPPTDAERIAEHLAGCDACRSTAEALRLIGPALQRIGGEGPSVDEVDHTFALARAGARAQRENPEQARIQDRDPARVSTRGRWLSYGVALAAGVLLTVGITRLATRSGDGLEPNVPSFTEKGAATGAESTLPEVNLSFSVQATPGGSLALGKNGWRYRPDDLLYFRCYLSQDGYLLLARVGPDGVEPLTPGGVAAPVSAGGWDLSDGRHLLGYSLENLKGTQRFVALFASAPFSLDGDVKAALQSGDAERGRLRQPVVQADSVTVDVTPR